MPRYLAVSVLVSLLVNLLLSPAAYAAPLKIGFLHENPVGQGGWTLSHELAREKIDRYFGDQIETSAIDGVAPGVDAERVLTKYARSGTDLIFATSFGFLNPTKKVAQRYKQVVFEHASGYLQSRNVGTYQVRAYQGRYLSGIVAGETTKTNVIGYIGSFPVPEVIRGINAFTLGVKSVNPDARIELIWTSSWSDPVKEIEATDFVIAKGADIVTHHTESASVMSAATRKKVYSIGYQSNRSDAAKDYHLVSVVHNWEPIYRDIIQSLLDQNWTSQSRWYGLESQATQLVDFGDVVKPATLDKIRLVSESIANGSFDIFAGPIRDQKGLVQVKEGVALSDAELMKMEWLVQGVSGKPNDE